ncbi:unnamed protein product [Ceutorhynchus assimilis]|uniref:Cytokine-like nuclear factor N-PAC n=1 Tax=Ceutorhynchus assimilis TaxID=467358 RepID=A0A9N9MG06_9CUCU|nr:unnamed protein product [Ceutorhynchus assimilis]
METESCTFREHDFVWAKMAGYNHWPAIVMTPDPYAPVKTTKDMQWIYFLGTHNYAWIEDKNIKPYEEFKQQFKKKSTESAMKEMEEIIANLAKDPEYKITFIKYVSKRPSPKKSKKSIGGTPVVSKKRPMPLKEKNTPAPKKKAKSSMSASSIDALNTTQEGPLVEDGLEKLKSVTLDTVNLGTSDKFFGILAGNTNYAEGIIRNLISSGHRLFVWSHSSVMNEELRAYAEQQGAFFRICPTPKQVLRNAEIIFSCLSDPEEAKIIINSLGVLDNLDESINGKGYVELSSIGPELSLDFSEMVTKKGGTYLEAMLQGNKKDADKGDLIVLAAGPQQLFVDCQSCFKAMGKASFLLGKIGSASSIHMIFQMMKGVLVSALVEGFAMADRCSIKLDAFNKVFNMTQMTSEYLKRRCDVIVNKNFVEAEEPLQQLQQDLRQGLEMSEKIKQPMRLASSANELLKLSRRMGDDNQDTACVYNRTRY